MAEGGAKSAMAEFLEQRLDESYDAVDAARIRAGWEAAAARPVTLRANTLKADAGEVAAGLADAGIAFERVSWYSDAFVLRGVRERAVWDLPLYAEGKVYLQSLSSMLPPLALRPQAGADILDMCAAPGGKTSQIAALTGGAAHITACEMKAPRADKLQHNLEKLGAGKVNVMRSDARRLDDFFRFDQVLVDASCTGSGTLRGADDPKAERITEALLAKTTRSQAALLDRALTLLKPGGSLVYSTCSVLPQENGEQLRRALAKHPDCRIDPLEEIGGVQVADAPFGRLPGGPEGTICICPDELFEGFYLARIVKPAR